MKKLIALLLTVVIIFSGTNVASAASNLSEQDNNKNKLSHEDIVMSIDEKISNDAKVPLRKISMNPLDKNEVESIIATYQLQPETVKDIYEYMEKVRKGSIQPGKINIYIPSTTPSQEISTSSDYRKTYVGYAGKTYYEEVLSYDNTSASVTVKEAYGFLDYLNKTIDAAAKYGFGTGMDWITKGMWSIGSIFTGGLPSGVPTNSKFRHESRLYEYKVKKFTYLVESGQYYFGSRVEMSISHFDNLTVFPGLHPIEYGENTKLESIITPSYDIPDQRAYYSYMNGGWVEPIVQYKYGGVYFDSI
jgi:hypothetical protein